MLCTKGLSCSCSEMRKIREEEGTGDGGKERERGRKGAVNLVCHEVDSGLISADPSVLLVFLDTPSGHCPSAPALGLLRLALHLLVAVCLGAAPLIAHLPQRSGRMIASSAQNAPANFLPTQGAPSSDRCSILIWNVSVVSVALSPLKVSISL